MARVPPVGALGKTKVIERRVVLDRRVHKLELTHRAVLRTSETGHRVIAVGAELDFHRPDKSTPGKALRRPAAIADQLAVLRLQKLQKRAAVGRRRGDSAASTRRAERRSRGAVLPPGV